LSSAGGFSSKTHLRSNGPSLPVAVILTGGQVSHVKGYDTDAILADLEAKGVAADIPPKRSCNVQPINDDCIYALRNLIERCFSKLKHSRRLATRYDKTADTFIGFVLRASIRLWVRHLVNRTQAKCDISAVTGQFLAC